MSNVGQNQRNYERFETFQKNIFEDPSLRLTNLEAMLTNQDGVQDRENQIFQHPGK